jgi:hypothetical protein
MKPDIHGVSLVAPGAVAFARDLITVVTLFPGVTIHMVRTHWIRGFMAFQLARRTWLVMLMVPVCPESGFR